MENIFWYAAAIIASACLYLCIIKRKSIKFALVLFDCEMNSFKYGFIGAINAVKYRNITEKLQSMPKRTAEVAIVTGGCTGIGLEVVRSLVNCGMRVVIGALDPHDHVDLLKEFRGNVEIFKLDLSTMGSVKRFASDVMEKYNEINILVNNAATMYIDYSLTEDGVETVWATNHLGAFYLTHLLTPNLIRGGELTKPRSSRIVNVSSCEHRSGWIDFDDVGRKKMYVKPSVYSQSKLALLMSALYFDKMFKLRKANVKCYAVSPGVVSTDILKKHPIGNFPRITDVVFKSRAVGAMDVVFACLSEEVETKSGLYYHNCQEERPSDYSVDEVNQLKLFQLSCNMISIKSVDFGN